MFHWVKLLPLLLTDYLFCSLMSVLKGNRILKSTVHIVGILRFFTVLETFSSSVGEIKRSNLRFARVFFSKNSNCCQVLRNKIILILTFSNIEFFSLYHSLTENLHALLGLSLNGTNERKKIKCMNEFSDFVINTGLFHSIEKIFSTFLS